MLISDLPYYHLVPKDFKKNCEFRQMLIREGCSDPNSAAELRNMCSKDILFWINTFCFTYDPRVKPYIFPMITYPFQDEAIMAYFNAYGKYDIATLKSRDMGASWMHIQVFKYMYDYGDWTSSLCVSRTEDFVDKSGDPKSLFWKIDFTQKHLPPFLKSPEKRLYLHFENNETGAVIDGSSTNEDIARGDRRTAILIDEAAAIPKGAAVASATRDSTDCRMLNSTPKGHDELFYESVNKGEIEIIKLHWSLHPIKAKGLYNYENGKLVLKDKFTGNVRLGKKEYSYPDDYPFTTDGKLRSPWYDNQCLRAAHPLEIAQELDMDFLGSNHVFFDQVALENHKKKYCCEPSIVGDMDFFIGINALKLKLAQENLKKNPSKSTLRALQYRIDNFNVGEVHGFVKNDSGKLRLWAELDKNGNMPTSDYVVSADIATGTGASNSVISIGDMKTKRKVGEFADPNTTPDKLAELAWAIAKWLGNSLIIWEQNGPGRLFGKKLIEPDFSEGLGYSNVYYKKQNNDDTRKRKTSIAGWASTRETKRVLLGEYNRALRDETMINPSMDGVKECSDYIYTSTGGIEHSLSVSTQDPSGAKDNHGDRVIADALLNLMFNDRPIIEEKKELKRPESSIGRRLELAREREENENRKWGRRAC